MKVLPSESDYLTMLIDSLDRYLRERYALDRRNSAAYGPNGFSREVHSDICQLGLVEAMTSTAKEFGGAGAAIAKIFESLGKALAVEPILGNVILVHALTTLHDQRYAPIISSLLDGSAVAAWAHYESLNADAGSPLEASCERTTGGWTLNGTKVLVRQGFDANWFLLSAHIPKSDSDATLEPALVLAAADTPGIANEARPCMAGGSASVLKLSRVFVPEDAVLARSSNAKVLLEDIEALEILALCAESVGLMKSAIESTKAYLGTRSQFGKTLNRFQALQHTLTDLDIEFFQAVGNVHRAAQLLGQKGMLRDRALASAKFTVGRVGKKVAESCVQMHGAIGMTWEAGISHYAKRLVMIDHECGDETLSLSRYMQLSGY